MAGPLPPGRRIRTGTVDSFDDDRGVGEVLADDGTRLFFHCTAVADGSRTIAAGTPVAFTVAAGHRGRREARAVTALGAPGPAPGG